MGLLIFVITLIILWRGFMQTWGPIVGTLLGMIPALAGAAILGAIAAVSWPVWVFMPIALYLAHRQKDRAERSAYLALHPQPQRARS